MNKYEHSHLVEEANITQGIHFAFVDPEVCSVEIIEEGGKVKLRDPLSV